MSKTRLVVILNEDDKAPQCRALVDTFQNLKCAWWHWFNGSYLVVDPAGRTAAWWAGRLEALLGDSYYVIDASRSELSGKGRKESAEWLDLHWKA